MKRRTLKLMVVVALVPGTSSLQAQPIITSQPASQTVLAGNTLILSVGVVGGGPLRFQWQFNGTNLPNNLISTVAGQSSVGFSGDAFNLTEGATC